MIPEDLPSAPSIDKLLQHVIVARAYNSRAKMRFVSEKNGPMPLCNCITRNVCSFIADALFEHREFSYLDQLHGQQLNIQNFQSLRAFENGTTFVCYSIIL